MSNKIVEVAQKSMETDDRIQKTYSGRIDGKYGYLAITRRKILFIKEEGFLSKSYSITYNLPFEKLRGYAARDRYNLEFEDTAGAKKVFVGEIPATVVETSLNETRGTGTRTVPVA